MQKTLAALVLTLLAAACTQPDTDAPVLDEETGLPIPVQVSSIAAPGQDLTTARLVESDQCYWYMHAGRVETTLVPLRAANGNHICNVRPS